MFYEMKKNYPGNFLNIKVLFAYNFKQSCNIKTKNIDFYYLQIIMHLVIHGLMHFREIEICTKS